MAVFEFDPVRASLALEQMRNAPAGLVAVAGEEWTHGAMGALVHAELLAAQAGVVPWIELPDGTRGVLTIGKAREAIDGAPEDVRTLYLATHALVRSTHARAVAAPPDVPMMVSAVEELGEPISVTVALVAVAVAAILATAWYFTHRETIQVEGRNLRTTSLVAEASQLGREQLERTGRIDPGLWEVFKEIADTEARSPWAPVALAGVVVAGGVGAFVAWNHYRGRREVRS